jgi:uncharacterized protein YbbK (DUF523 family)
MQRWEYWVVSLRGEQYTAALNELGNDGWELVSVTSEPVAARAPEQRGGLPVPRALGRLEEAADKLTKLGASDPADDLPAGATSRLLWIFRRPLSDERAQ